MDMAPVKLRNYIISLVERRRRPPLILFLAHDPLFPRVHPLPARQGAGMYTRVDPKHGHVAAESPAALKAAGNEALQAGHSARASHMYTLALDLLLERRPEGSLSAADWFALEASSEGLVSTLLSNRSLALLRQGDHAGAADDAERCCQANPGWAKAHLRLLAAHEAGKAQEAEVLSALRRGLRACPISSQLREALAKAEAQQELDAMMRRGAARAAHPTSGGAESGAASASEEAALAAQLEVTRRAADDPADPRRFIATGDLGAALAVGAHGLPKDVVSAERYLRVAADGGDVVSMRNLGHLLLQLQRLGDAAAAFERAAAAGDEDSAGILAGMQEEAQRRTESARDQLARLAANGNPQAVAMLEQLCKQHDGIVV
jgi:tetratricopeptide (TPR) repeat protein